MQRDALGGTRTDAGQFAQRGDEGGDGSGKHDNAKLKIKN
jgi:hypothetical protein